MQKPPEQIQTAPEAFVFRIDVLPAAKLQNGKTLKLTCFY